MDDIQYNGTGFQLYTGSSSCGTSTIQYVTLHRNEKNGNDSFCFWNVLLHSWKEIVTSYPDCPRCWVNVNRQILKIEQ